MLVKGHDGFGIFQSKNRAAGNDWTSFSGRYETDIDGETYEGYWTIRDMDTHLQYAIFSTI